ncbi:MAG: leucyl aminopeptidase family protein [Hyphomicrobium aestuarii]|nr:leucyl aminopeptidase family protein [Hyphomicrobium aestuarii]
MSKSKTTASSPGGGTPRSGTKLFESARVAQLYFDGPGGMPIHFVRDGENVGGGMGLGAHGRRWLKDIAFQSAAKKQALVPGADGSFAAVVLGLGNGQAGEPVGPSELLAGQLAASLPPRDYHLPDLSPDGAYLAALAWGLGAYRYRRYRSSPMPAEGAHAADGLARLAWPERIDRHRVIAEVEAVFAGRDLINTPASDLGPEEIEAAVRSLAALHGASVSVIAGDDLLAKNFPLIHAVGRASSRAPRLIDMTWGVEDARKVTLVGKGIVFDTGGLDIKSSSGMLLMKKDMGGSAVSIAIAHMIMATKQPVRLRVIIAAAENSISGNAFRPSDVIASRLGPTVEIGNTDAEGRLVLADALALADEEAPDTLLTFSTLTGAARVALGPDLPALFTDDDAFAAELVATGCAIGDPVWRMPLWPGYERGLDSEVADMGNVSDSPFAGAITAALFLRRFVKNTRRFAHFDLYGWRPAPRPLGPKGGEPQTARTVFDVLSREARA